MTVKSLAETLAERRDLAPMTARCAVDGCDWPGMEGTSAECRDAAAAHRLTAHPELRDRGQRARQEAARPRKHPSSQTAEDKRIVRDLAARSRKQPRPPKGPGRRPSRLTDERRALALRLNREGWSLYRVAKEYWAEWGYASSDSCHMSMKHALAGDAVKVPRSRRQESKYGRLTEDRFAVCRTLFDAGISVQTIARLAYELLGYETIDSCRSVITYRLRRAGVQLGGGRHLIPELNRREVEQLLATIDDTGHDRRARPDTNEPERRAA